MVDTATGYRNENQQKGGNEMGKTRVALAILALAAACLLGMPAAPALAEDAAPNGTDALQLQDDEIVASGDWGTCPWTIDSTGKLTVRPGTGGEAADIYAARYEAAEALRVDGATR